MYTAATIIRACYGRAAGRASVRYFRNGPCATSHVCGHGFMSVADHRGTQVHLTTCSRKR